MSVYTLAHCDIWYFGEWHRILNTIVSDVPSDCSDHTTVYSECLCSHYQYF